MREQTPDDFTESDLRDEIATLRAEQTRLREALRDCVEAMEAMIGKREAGFAIEEIIDAGHAALSSTPTPRPGFDCAMCGHRHQDERFAFICIGCPCQSTPATPTPETTP